MLASGMEAAPTARLAIETKRTMHTEKLMSNQDRFVALPRRSPIVLSILSALRLQDRLVGSSIPMRRAYAVHNGTLDRHQSRTLGDS